MYFLKTSSRTSQSIRRVNVMRMNSQVNKMRLLDTSPATAKVNKINFPCNIMVSSQSTYTLQFYLGKQGYLKTLYPSEGHCLQHKTAEPLSDAFVSIPNTMLPAVDTQCSGIAYSVV